MLEHLKASIDELLQKWKQAQPLKKQYQQTFDHKLRLQWNYQSNHIEGNTLTYHQTELLLIQGRYEGGHLERHYTEMKAHDVAISQIYKWAQDQQRPLNEADVRDLNKIILKEPFVKKAQTPEGQPTNITVTPGQYKERPNHVKTSTGQEFKFAEPHEVPEKMRQIVNWLQAQLQKPSLHLLEVIAKLHYDFIRIHPFDDGNGRVARLLVNYVLLLRGCVPLVVRSEDKQNYFTALQKADAGDAEAFTVYMGEQMVHWLKLGLKAANGLSIEEPADADKDLQMFVRSKQTSPQASKKLLLQFYDTSFIKLCQSLESKTSTLAKLFKQKKVYLGTANATNNSTRHFCGSKLSVPDVKMQRQALEEYSERYGSQRELYEYIDNNPDLREDYDPKNRPHFALQFCRGFFEYQHTDRKFNLYLFVAVRLRSHELGLKIFAWPPEGDLFKTSDDLGKQPDIVYETITSTENDYQLLNKAAHLYEHMDLCAPVVEQKLTYDQVWSPSDIEALVGPCQKQLLSLLKKVDQAV